MSRHLDLVIATVVYLGCGWFAFEVLLKGAPDEERSRLDRAEGGEPSSAVPNPGDHQLMEKSE
jgi:hypothetical protein